MQLDPELTRKTEELKYNLNKLETSGREFLHYFLLVEKDLLSICSNIPQRQILGILKQLSIQWENILSIVELAKPKDPVPVVQTETVPDVILPATPNPQ